MAGEAEGALLMAGDFEARQQERLIQSYERYINALAARLRRHYRLPFYLEPEDLAQAGRIGLLTGLGKCDWRKQSRQIDNYLKTRIRGAMLDEIRAQLPSSRRFSQDRVYLEPLAGEHEDLPAPDVQDLLFILGVLNRIRDSRQRAIMYRDLVLGDTLAEIARDLGYTPGRISQVRSECLQELRETGLY
jgi:RNA polymerase sigma factor (sigma-70 family)